MKKSLLLLSSLLVLSNVSPVLAGDKEDRIKEIETQIEKLEAELKELKGEDGEGLGQTVTVEDVEITVKEAYYSTKLNPTSDKEADKVLVLKYDVKNNQKDEIFASMNIDVYADGMKLETYPYVGGTSPKISSGKGSEVIAGYAIKDGVKELELEFRPQYLGETGKEIVKINEDELELVDE